MSAATYAGDQCDADLWRARRCVAAGYAYPSTPAGIGGYNYAPELSGVAAAAGYATAAQITNPTRHNRRTLNPPTRCHHD
jgi:hypothetical protein